MSESNASRSVTWTRNAGAVLAAILAAACVDDSVAPGPHGAPEGSQPSVFGFVEVTFDGIGTPDQSASVLSAPSIAALEELRAERERLRESGEDIALIPTPIQEGDTTIQFGTRTSNGVSSHAGRWYGHGTFNIRNAQADGTAYTSARNNLTLQAISTDNSLSGTAIRRLTLNNGDPADPLVALDVLPSGRVTTVDDTLAVVKPDVLQLVAEADIQHLNSDLPPGVNTIFPYGFVVRHVDDPGSRTLPIPTGPDDFQGEVDIAYSMPLVDGENIGSMSITFIALDYGLDATWVTQSREEQTDAGALAVAQRAQDLNAQITTMLPSGWEPPGSPPGPRCLDSVRTAGLPGSPTAYLSKTDWTSAPTFDPADGVAISTDQIFQITFDTDVHGIGPRQLTVHEDPANTFHFLQDITFHAGSGTSTITTPQGSFAPGSVVELTAHSCQLTESSANPVQ